MVAVEINQANLRTNQSRSGSVSLVRGLSDGITAAANCRVSGVKGVNMRFVPEILKDLSRCDLVAHDFVKLVLEKRLLFTMSARGNTTDCLGFTHCNGVSFQQGSYIHDRHRNCWDECSIRGLVCAQIVQYLDLPHFAQGWLVDSPTGGKAAKEYWMHLELYPFASAIRESGRDAHRFYSDCLKTVGKRWFDKMAKGTSYEGDYQEFVLTPTFNQ